MIRRIILRSLICAALIALIFADGGISNIRVGMSVCIFLMFECSLLAKKRFSEIAFMLIPYLTAVLTVDLTAKVSPGQIFGFVIIFAFGIYEYYTDKEIEKMRSEVHKVRDEGIELSQKLIKANRMLRAEQDREVHLATLSERNRIAREIHDNVGHKLSRAIILLGAIKTVNRDENVTGHLETLSDTLDSAMEEMRTSVHDLHDEAVDLEKNIDDILSEIPVDRFRVQRDLDIGQDLDSKTVLTLIAICKEAVSNALKHSKGDRIEVTIHEHPGFVTMIVQDNGFVSEKVKKMLEMKEDTGIGLSNIMNRAAELGGNADITGDDGFRIFVNLPKNKNV